MKKLILILCLMFSLNITANTIQINDSEQLLIELNKLTTNTSNQDIVFKLAEGDYFFQKEIEITPQMTNHGRKIIFQGSDKTNFFSGIEITNFEQVPDKKYLKAFIGKNLDVYNFFASDKNKKPEITTEARTPDSGYYKVKQKASNDKSGFFIDKKIYDLIDKDSAFTIWPGKAHYNWMTLKSRISAFNKNTGELHAELVAGYYYDKGSRFYLTGSEKYLSRPGEYYYNNNSGYIFYYPYNNKTPALGVAATTPQIIKTSGTIANPIKNLTIKNINFMLTNYTDNFKMAAYNTEPERNGMIRLESTINSTITNCRFFNAGFSAISVTGASSNNLIENNEIAYAGYNGIFLLGYAVDAPEFETPEQAYLNKSNTIRNNLIYSCGQKAGHACGIQLYQSGDNLIENNTIYDMPRYAVSYKGTAHWGNNSPLIPGNDIYGIKITLENRYRFLHTRNNILRNNDMSNCMTDSQDGGIFEAWASGINNIIENNFFHDTKIGIDGGLLLGIYLDDGCDYYKIKNNVIQNLSGTQTYPMYTKGKGHIVENNFIINCDAKADIAAWAMMGIENKNLTFNKNIFFQPKSKEIYRFFDWSKDKIKECNNNIYWHGKNSPASYKIGGIPGADRLWWWKNLYSNKFDRNSKTADPKLIINGKKFSFASGSPAVELGISPVDLESAGASLKETIF